MDDDALVSASQEQLREVRDRFLPDLPHQATAVRVLMVRHLIVQMCAETSGPSRRALTARLNWEDTALPI